MFYIQEVNYLLLLVKNKLRELLKKKVTEICTLVPAFERELDRRPGKTKEGKDYCQYMFKNGSYFDNIAARESSRGKRRHGGLIEECVGVDGVIYRSYYSYNERFSFVYGWNNSER